MRSAPAATLDVSSDLEELARTPLAVVCAGPKAILDLPLTLEYLETRGVPVVAVGQAEMPGFYSTSSGVAAPHVVPGVAEAAWLVATHLGLGLGSRGSCCASPVPAAVALPFDDARRRDRAGPGRSRGGRHRRSRRSTPWLLARVAELTDGASVRANTALIENDARVAGARWRVARLAATWPASPPGRRRRRAR